tara:strand:+ start:1055 stop:2671 length:1617 start_codon:yes stop_codon:yes gene_type:complete
MLNISPKAFPPILSVLVLLALYASIIYSNSEQLILGNISVYAIHALSLLEEGTLSFILTYEDVEERFLPNFHTFLYPLILGLGFLVVNFITGTEFHLGFENINNLIKIINSLLLFLTGWVFSSFFEVKDKISRILIASMYLLLPFSIYGIFSVEPDQILTPLFLLLAFKFLQNKKFNFSIIFFTLAILTKETMGLVGLSALIFGEIFFSRNLSIKKGIYIWIASFSFAVFGYISLCLYLGFPVDFIFLATQFHVETGGFKFKNLSLFAREFFVAVMLPFFAVIQLEKRNLILSKTTFAVFLLITVFLINILSGYINIRYLSALMPIILVLLLTDKSKSFNFRPLSFVFGIFFSLVILFFYGDPGKFIMDLDFSLNLFLNIQVWFFLTIAFFILYTTKRFSLDRFSVYVGFSACAFLYMGSQNYQINFQYGLPNANLALSKISTHQALISDLPSSQLYFRDKVIFSYPPSEHFFSETSMPVNPDEGESTYRLENIVESKLLETEFFVFTIEESVTSKFFKEKENCKEIHKNYYHVYQCE